ncbi:hypothetical protein [Leptospira kirschneri]|uniref:hypothetical protein n=1 Tax=Leptospira kirschneri TaxID=29507 RepID=UPI000990EA28|nr:hypothetical protein [Leptospira kirschneri]
MGPFRVISNSHDFKSYFSERNFAVVPTFKESIYKVQIPTFFRIIVFLHRIHVILKFTEFLSKINKI